MTTTLDALLNENKKFTVQFNENLLMKLIRSSELSKPEARHKLLDSIQVFSDYFQRTVMLREVLCDDPKFQVVTQQHLMEEFGHNLSLLKDRKGRPKKWDPIIETCASWFAYKMFTLDQEEKTVIVHLILEASANVFFKEAHEVMQSYGETNYFKIHSDADEGHEQMGRELLKDLTPSKYSRLFEIQFQGWSVLNTLCEQIARQTSN